MVTAAACRQAETGVHITRGRPIVIRLGHIGIRGSLYDLGAQRFKQLVEARLPGRVEVRVFPASQLGDDREMLDGLRLGTLELHVPSSVLHGIEPLLGVFELPFLIEDRRQLERLYQGPLGVRIHEALRKRGLVLLAFWENGFRVITNNVRPIVTPADLHGIKLRTPKDPERVRLFQVLGANPASLAFSELFTALRQGAVDGQENPLAQIVSARLYEVQKFLSLSHHVYSPAYPIMARRYFDALPEDVRRVLVDAAEEAGRYQREVGQQQERTDLELCAKFLQITRIDRAAFLRAAAPLYDEFVGRVGQEPIEAARRARGGGPVNPPAP